MRCGPALARDLIGPALPLLCSGDPESARAAPGITGRDPATAINNN